MNIQTQSAIPDRYWFLRTILYCPITKGPLRPVGIDEFLSFLPDTGRERVRHGTIGAFISVADNRVYPLAERVANFLKQDSIEIQIQSRRIAPWLKSS
jgi:uncharacterized protein YbaR (Trm112 family)